MAGVAFTVIIGVKQGEHFKTEQSTKLLTRYDSVTGKPYLVSEVKGTVAIGKTVLSEDEWEKLEDNYGNQVELPNSRLMVYTSEFLSKNWKRKFQAVGCQLLRTSSDGPEIQSCKLSASELAKKIEQVRADLQAIGIDAEPELMALGESD